MPTPELLDAFLRLGASGLLALAVIAFVKEWVVPGGAHKRAVAERDAAYARLDRLADLFEAKK